MAHDRPLQEASRVGWRWVGPVALSAWGLVLLLAVPWAEAATDPPPCARLKQRWLDQKERIERSERKVRGGVSPALRDFQRRCPEDARAALEALSGSKGTSESLPGAASPTAASAAQSTTSRVKTEGYYTDWERHVESTCASGTAAARTACAQAKIDRAIVEGRLSQGEVDACRSPAASRPMPTPRDPVRAERMRDTAARRFAVQGGDAYWAWDAAGGCRLADRVKLSFAAVAAPQAAASPGVTAKCELMPNLPRCAPTPQAAPSADKLPDPYVAWANRAVMRCAERSVRGQPRDHCVRSVLEEAVATRRLTQSAVDRCRAAWAQGAKADPEYLEAFRCIERAALVEQAGSSAVLKVAEPRVARRAMRGDGYQRPDIVTALQAGDWAYMPVREGDGNYYLNVFAKLAAACPSREFQATSLRMTQIAQDNLRGSLQRAASGEGTLNDLNRLLFAADSMLKAAKDCDKEQWHPGAYDACVDERDSAFQLPPSREARRDVDVLLQRHGCNGAETAAIGKNLSTWLVMAPHRRGAMSWVTGSPREGEWRPVFENCRRQAAPGVADAWCGCYVRRYADTRSGGYHASPEAMSHVRSSAFVGGEGMRFQPGDMGDCEAGQNDIEAYRRDQRAQSRTTACLVSQSPVADAILPDLKTCRYRTAWGEIAVKLPQCRSTWSSHEWGWEPVTC